MGARSDVPQEVHHPHTVKAGGGRRAAKGLSGRFWVMHARRCGRTLWRRKCAGLPCLNVHLSHTTRTVGTGARECKGAPGARECKGAGRTGACKWGTVCPGGRSGVGRVSGHNVHGRACVVEAVVRDLRLGAHSLVRRVKAKGSPLLLAVAGALTRTACVMPPQLHAAPLPCCIHSSRRC